MDLYAENILEHYRNPRGKKRLPKPTVAHEEVNAGCGDTLTLDLQIKGGRVEKIGWAGVGCAISQAGMSLLAEQIDGKPLAGLAALSPKDIRALLGVPISQRRLKCAMLPLLALQNALRILKKEPLLTWAELLEEDIR